jgi:hypothetical protein
MELLGTLHWVMTQADGDDDIARVTAKVQSWSARKRSQMKDGHIRAAWSRLKGLGWTHAAA